MKYILPIVFILFFISSCKKKEESHCSANIFPMETKTPPSVAEIISVEKDGNSRTITFKGKVTTIYLDRNAPNRKIRYVYELQYDKLCLTSVTGDTPYEFFRTGPHTYVFKHNILSSDETNSFQIDDFSAYYGNIILDAVSY